MLNKNEQAEMLLKLIKDNQLSVTVTGSTVTIQNPDGTTVVFGGNKSSSSINYNRR